LRILVADDHHSVRRVVCGVLAAEGWDVCGQAINGREAVEMAEQLKPDVVVLDLSMPELNGLEATRQILQKMPHTDVLILTAYEGEDLVRAAVESGARACVGKTDLDHLVMKVQSLFQSNQCSQPHVNSLQEAPPQPRASEGMDDSITELTDIERQILQLLAKSKTNKEIAVALSINLNTVQVYRSTIMAKLGLDSVVECVRYAVRLAVRHRTEGASSKI
jgi:DNA-binding NarL/FixJ family response regulator